MPSCAAHRQESFGAVRAHSGEDDAGGVGAYRARAGVEHDIHRGSVVAERRARYQHHAIGGAAANDLEMGFAAGGDEHVSGQQARARSPSTRARASSTECPRKPSSAVRRSTSFRSIASPRRSWVICPTSAARDCDRLKVAFVEGSHIGRTKRQRARERGTTGCSTFTQVATPRRRSRETKSVRVRTGAFRQGVPSMIQWSSNLKTTTKMIVSLGLVQLMLLFERNRMLGILTGLAVLVPLRKSVTVLERVAGGDLSVRFEHHANIARMIPRPLERAEAA